MDRWLILLLYLIYNTNLVGGQTPVSIPSHSPGLVEGGGENIAPPRDELSPAHEQAMWEEIQHNVDALRHAGTLAAPNAAQTVTFTFPLRLIPGLPDTAGYKVSAFADHNPTAGQVLD